jgi:hypothetical protein
MGGGAVLEGGVLIEEEITVQSVLRFSRYLPRRKSWRKDVVISANKRVLETVF